MKTIFDIIDAVLKDYFGNDFEQDTKNFSNPNLGIKYERFTKILCDPKNPMYSSRRTIRMKWNLLHELDYLVKVNQRASKMNLQKIYEDFYKME